MICMHLRVLKDISYSAEVIDIDINIDNDFYEENFNKKDYQKNY